MKYPNPLKQNLRATYNRLALGDFGIWPSLPPILRTYTGNSED
ncbi:MAG: hypothetical protein P8J27_04345 [Mariniblastus sp.]|nr:hypothetical protein [Mariniblastus sp.]